MDGRSKFCDFTPEQVAAAAFVAALSISQGQSADELGLLSSFFFNIGSVLGVLSRQKALLESDACSPAQPC